MEVIWCPHSDHHEVLWDAGYGPHQRHHPHHCGPHRSSYQMDRTTEDNIDLVDHAAFIQLDRKVFSAHLDFTSPPSVPSYYHWSISCPLSDWSLACWGLLLQDEELLPRRCWTVNHMWDVCSYGATHTFLDSYSTINYLASVQFLYHFISSTLGLNQKLGATLRSVHGTCDRMTAQIHGVCAVDHEGKPLHRLLGCFEL